MAARAAATSSRVRTSAGGSGLRLAAVVAAVGRRPDLWLTALRQVVVLAPSGWWRRWPPLPTPDQAYLHFRLQTAYGADEAAVPPSDVVGYLEWCRRVRVFRG